MPVKSGRARGVVAGFVEPIADPRPWRFRGDLHQTVFVLSHATVLAGT